MKDASLAERYAAVREKLDDACVRSGRVKGSVTLLAASKYQPLAAIFELYHLGQHLFGENYVQEAKEKQAAFDAQNIDSKACFHLIGPLQRRKASQVAGCFALIHALDSLKVALSLERVLAQRDLLQPVLIEVNIASEAQKAGVLPHELFQLAEDILRNCRHLVLQGLMCLPPQWAEGDTVRRYFAKLRDLKTKLACETGLTLPHLSMGMSNDFPLAVEEGASIVRVGTALFGPRPAR